MNDARIRKMALMLVGFGIGLTLAGVGQMDYQEAVGRQAEACRMHRLWISGSWANLPPEARSGWPIAEDEYQEKCAGVASVD